MNQIGVLQLVLEKTDRTYHMLVPLGAPFEEALEAGVEFVEQIRSLKNAQAVQAAQAAAQSAPADTNPDQADPSAG
jgi:hypothetical protein